MEAFKIKYKGHTLKVRKMEPNETIQKKSLKRHKLWDWKWAPSSAVGDKVRNHPYFEYILVVSQFYEGESKGKVAGE